MTKGVKKLTVFTLWIAVPALVFLLIYTIENQRVVNVSFEVDKPVLSGDGLEVATLTFKSVDTDGNPLSGHLVEFVMQGQGMLGRRRALTDENGEATLTYQCYRITSFVPAGTVTIEGYDTSVGTILEIRRKAEFIIKVVKPTDS